MKTAIEVHKEIKKKASHTLKKVVEINNINVDQHVRQGDIYIRRIKLITGKIEVKTRQLAPGETKGSRHIVADSPHVKLFEGYSGSGIVDFMKGPQIEAKESFTITHPEHAHIKLPSGSYQVTYQMDYLLQERVRD
jgi:hypothetical protein